MRGVVEPEPRGLVLVMFVAGAIGLAAPASAGPADWSSSPQALPTATVVAPSPTSLLPTLRVSAEPDATPEHFGDGEPGTDAAELFGHAEFAPPAPWLLRAPQPPELQNVLSFPQGASAASVPLPAFGTLSLMAVGGGLCFLGKRWLGL